MALNFEITDYLSITGVLLTTYVAYFYYKYFTRINPLPGPFPLPFIGNLIDYLWLSGDIKLFLDNNHKKYGDVFEIYLGGTRRIVLNRPGDIENLLIPSTKSQYLLRTPYMKGLDELGIMGKGIISNHNLESWRYNRQFFTQAILSPKFAQEAIDWTNKLFHELEGYWNNLYLKEGKNNTLNFASWLNRYTNDMIIALTTGERSYTMAGHYNTKGDEKSEHPTAIIEDSESFVRAFRKHIVEFTLFLFVPDFVRHYVPIIKGKSDSIIQNANYLFERIDTVVKKRRKEIENTPLDKPLPHDMLTSLITANTSRDVNYTKTVGGKALERPMTDIEIRHIMFDAFIAGTDTTANTISFIVYYLGHYPDVKKKMLEEIDRIFQGDKTRPITENDFHNLKYCEAIVKEVNRLYPVANVLGRYSSAPGEVAGYKWPAGTAFQVNAPAIHKHGDYWEDSDKFNPDRWMAEGFEPKKYSFIMFGGGLRICPGRKLAMIELICLMALLYRRYEIDLEDMEAPLKTKTTGVSACYELLVKIKPREYK